MIKKPKIRKNELTPFQKMVFHTWKKGTDPLIKQMEKHKRQMDIIKDEIKSMMPEKPIDSFPILRIELDAVTMDGGDELYDYLQKEQGIEIDCNKNYLQDKGVGNEFFSEEDDYLFLYIKREDLKDEKAFEKKMHNYFFKNFEIMFSHHQM